MDLPLAAPHASEELRQRVDQLQAAEMPEAAIRLIASCRAGVSAEEVEAELLGNFPQQRGDVVVVGHADHSAAAAALNKHELEAGPPGLRLFDFKP